MDGSVVFTMWRNCAPHVIDACLLGGTRVQILNVISIGSVVFAQLIADVLVLYNGPHLPLKIALPIGIWTPS